jgi:hypothetical protein
VLGISEQTPSAPASEIRRERALGVASLRTAVIVALARRFWTEMDAVDDMLDGLMGDGETEPANA